MNYLLRVALALALACAYAYASNQDFEDQMLVASWNK